MYLKLGVVHCDFNAENLKLLEFRLNLGRYFYYFFFSLPGSLITERLIF